MRKRVHVTARDIRLGQRADPFSCPVARAMRRATPKRYTFTGVSSFGADFIDTAREVSVTNPTSRDIPDEAVDWIQSYDAEEFVQPFTFELDFPE